MKKLNNVKIQKISELKRNQIWNKVLLEKNGVKKVGTPSIIRVFSIRMGTIAIFLAVLLGLGGTAVASNEAKPGDALYKVDKSIEEVRYFLAGENTKEKLRVKFAEERVEELQEVLQDDSSDDTSKSENTSIDLSSGNLTAFEIDIFTDITVAKIEVDDVKYYFMSSSTDPEEVLSEVSENYFIDIESLRKIMVVETEDRASRPKDKGNVSTIEDGVSKESFDDTVEAIESLSDKAQSDELKSLLADLLLYYVDDEEIERIDIKYTDGTKIDIKDDDFRIKTDNIDIRFKDGEIRIKDKSEDDDEDDGDEDDNKGHGNDDDRIDDNNPGKSFSDDSEDEEHDSDDQDDSEEELDDDNSGHGNINNEDDEEDEEELDDDNSGHGSGGEDEDEDDDNSGHGGGDDDDDN